MPAPQYSCSTEAAVALTAATAKSVVGVRAHANSGIMVCGFTISFADTNAAEVPALVELMYATFATNAPGTNSTSTTPRQLFGRLVVAVFAWLDVSGSPQVPTSLTGCGITFTRMDTTDGNPTTVPWQVTYSGWADPGSVTSGALTLSGVVSTGTADGAIWAVVELDGVDMMIGDADTDGTRRGFLNQATVVTTNDTATPTTAARRNTDSLFMSAATCYDNASTTAPTLTIPTGWTQQTAGAQAIATQSIRLAIAYDTTGDTTANWVASAANDRMAAQTFEYPGIGRTIPRQWNNNDAVHRSTRW